MTELLDEIAALAFGQGSVSFSKKTDAEKKEQRHKTLQNVAIGTNVVGGVAGPAALYSAARSAKKNEGGIPRDLAIAATTKSEKKGGGDTKFAGTKAGRKVKAGLNYIGAGFKPGASKGQRAAAIGSGAGLVGLQAVNWGGDVLSAKLLNDQKKKDKVNKRLVPISKMEPGGSDLHAVGQLTPASMKRKAAKTAYEKGQPRLKRVYTKRWAEMTGDERGAQLAQINANSEKHPVSSIIRPKKTPVYKSMTFEGEISKVDVDRRQVFGWASIVELNGEPVVDLQGDYIDIDEIEKSAYEYVIKSRKGGDMHRRNGEEAYHASDMIESFLVTPEKKEKLGLPDSMPTGWWVGYQINDPEAWELVKSGKRTGFSIHGKGMRTPVEI